ncbi:MAG: GNAT family N-acetyltransferase [Bryobacterales bacterium]|nr:GNAT family N-acetyltransferase [Bryobacterales bacterium]
MSATRRKHIRRSVRQLQSHPAGEASILCYRELADLPRMFHDCEQVARKTYQRGLRVGFADNPQTRARLENAAAQGWLRAYILYLGDRPCAFWIGMLYHTVFVSEYMGYDPEYRQSSPGMVLIMRVLERFCTRAQGDIVAEVDFGLGHAEYKECLCTKYWDESSVCIFSCTGNGFMLKCMRITTKILDACARRVLASFNILPRIKRAWRDHLANNANPHVSRSSKG